MKVESDSDFEKDFIKGETLLYVQSDKFVYTHSQNLRLKCDLEFLKADLPQKLHMSFSLSKEHIIRYIRPSEK